MTCRQTKRILMLLENNSFPNDTRVLLEATSLVEAGFQVTVVCPTGSSTLKYERIGAIHVYRYPAPWEINGVIGYLMEYSYSLFMAFVYAWYIFFRRGFDAIHVHAPPDVNALVPALFQLFGKKFVYDMHDLSPELLQAQRGKARGILHRGLLLFERFACRRADRLIATNQTQQNVQTDRCRVDPSRCHIVRNGPNAKFLGDVSSNETLHKGDKQLIGYVGLIGVQDGVDCLIRALHELRATHHRDDFHCIVVGGGPAMNDLVKLSHELGVYEHIKFTGMIEFEEVPAVIAAFDICTTPDPSNPYNDSCTTIKTMEYMALGKPTVCFRTGENEVTAGPSALYAENNDIAEFARQLCVLLDNPEKRAAMGQIARQRIEDGLTWKHQAEELVLLYDRLFHTAQTGDAGRIAASWETEPQASLPQVRFAFDGRLADLLRRFLLKDVESSSLSRGFRLYYRLRPLIPSPLRKFMQRRRNRGMSTRPDWYMSHEFVTAWESAVAEESLHDDRNIIHPWPDDASHAVVLTHDIETIQGMQAVDRLARIEEEHGFRSAWFVIPHKYRVDHGLLRDLQDRGHEIGVHGYNHDGRLFTNKRIFCHRAGRINAVLKKFGATGFRAPMVHRDLQWMQELSVDYEASCFDCDPYQAMPGGVGGVWPFRCGRFIELPYTLPQDHTLLALGQLDHHVWISKHRLIKALHGMVLLITHPDYLDTPDKLDEYRKYIEYLSTERQAWCRLPSEVATWWRQRDASHVSADNPASIIGPASHSGRCTSLRELYTPPQAAFREMETT